MSATSSSSAGPLEAARRLQHRMQDKDTYRRKRDAKIAVDFIGAIFDYEYDGGMYSIGLQEMQLRLVSYSPDSHSVVMRPVDERIEGSITWETDWFWILIRNSKLVKE